MSSTVSSIEYLNPRPQPDGSVLVHERTTLVGGREINRETTIPSGTSEAAFRQTRTDLWNAELAAAEVEAARETSREAAHAKMVQAVLAKTDSESQVFFAMTREEVTRLRERLQRGNS